ncbi:MAG: hypothetical protein UU73_C0001G0353 [Candidatus Daviesbacteria bacterium GW2011_GWA1_41_61]|uniref:YokE-like PH domain-containing protein n=1 Tax=Candidatus Daviesbacteria bacterium GW2011_GWA2_40_9 TaxID=1618424 RepID=A0A0G0TZY6_9BACT|nr:MAG: hypothetical protein UU26_C0016G0021 [Candidatus Daviesbacteria bacterium GW2011_GWC1_40_9]KKR82469.1 MAG: hypothetical protein UU29_C0012G0007 [Candidatus Daviesbacteria bacterium GW2011_GWA2_40_9]KKR93172.1 MAG: hypothetical protein UU44_C0004G0354 [Candidatus Daviesbacteria bacterium GW2011_GWB1_41_15]KKS15716.1 MAG: hypothetical protein UU73_C0001G0353 [Candidatus Daviesbacteria bacterium GW2011_GWA1_41_61]
MLAHGEIHFNHFPKRRPPQKAQKVEEKPTEEAQNSKAQAEAKMEELIEEAENPLFKLSTIFPFDFFPDQIIIDTNKVNIISKEFFSSGRVHSIMIKDIGDVFIETDPFFAKLTIIDKGFTENSINLKYLKKEDAAKARKIIQGLVVAHEQSIDLAHFPPEELTLKLEKLGKIKTER